MVSRKNLQLMGEKTRYHSVFWCGLWGTISATTVGRTQVVKRILDKGELISKTVEDVAQTKAEATEHVVFMVVVGVVLSVAILAAALYFRRPPQKES